MPVLLLLLSFSTRQVTEIEKERPRWIQSVAGAEWVGGDGDPPCELLPNRVTGVSGWVRLRASWRGAICRAASIKINSGTDNVVSLVLWNYRVLISIFFFFNYIVVVEKKEEMIRREESLSHKVEGDMDLMNQFSLF